MNQISELAEQFDRFDGSRSKIVLFTDWVKMMAISISNQVWHNEQREKEYMQLATTYSEAELERFGDMFGMLTLLFENDIDDYLGKIYMMGDMGNKGTGQFFTPFHLAELTARLSFENQYSHYIKKDRIEINEPASGGGAMILALAKVMRDEGINYQQVMRVTAQDLDWTGVYMSYVQLSLIGINAKVIQGDSLMDERVRHRQILYTPAYILQGGEAGWTKSKIA